MHAQHENRMTLDQARPLNEYKPMGARLTMKSLKSLIRSFTLGMAALSIPTLAIAQPTFVELGNTGKLLKQGMTVAVSVQVACTDGSTSAFVTVSLAQRTRGGNVTRVLTGSEDIPDCGSTIQTVRFSVQTSDDQKRFARGPALARAFLNACDSNGDCGMLRDAEEIRLRR